MSGTSSSNKGRIATGNVCETNEELRSQVKELTEKCRNMENAMYKLHYENVRLRHQICTLEKELGKYAAFGAVPSKGPSVYSSENNMVEEKMDGVRGAEFKKLWDEIVMDRILDVFPPTMTRNITVAHMVQSLALGIYNITKSKKQAIVSDIAALLSSQESSVLKCISTLFQQNKDSIFKLTEEQLKTLQSNMQVYVVDKSKSPCLANIFEKDSPGREVIVKLLKVVTTMVLEQPEYYFPVDPASLPLTYNKQKHYCVDGFIKDDSPCLLVLPVPVSREQKGIDLPGLRPAVLPLQEDSKETRRVSVPDLNVDLATPTKHQIEVNSYVSNTAWKKRKPLKKRMSTVEWQIVSAESKTTGQNQSERSDGQGTPYKTDESSK